MIIKDKLRRFFQTEFFAAFSTSSVTTGIQMLIGIVVNKVVAITIGPSGIALVGQFVNFKIFTTNLASGSFGKGITKYIADPEFSNEKIVNTSVIFSFSISIFIGALTAMFSSFLSEFLFKDDTYYYVFVLFGFLLPFFALNKLILAAVNGFRMYKMLAYLKITNNVVALIFSTTLVLIFKLKGAFLAHAINSSIVFFISLILINYYFSVSDFIAFKIKKFDKSLLKMLLMFSLMALTSAQLKPLIEFFVRDYIIENGNEFDAGIWQGMVNFSKIYIQIITTALGVYYLPRLASLKYSNSIRKEILSGYKKIIPGFLVIALLIYFLRDWMILLLYSNDFSVMSSLFFPQLVGDFFKIVSFLVAYLLLAKAMIKLFMITQIVFAVTRISFSILLFEHAGIYGVIWANAVNYFIYSIVILFLFRNLLFQRQHDNKKF